MSFVKVNNREPFINELETCESAPHCKVNNYEKPNQTKYHLLKRTQATERRIEMFPREGKKMNACSLKRQLFVL